MESSKNFNEILSKLCADDICEESVFGAYDFN